MAKIVLVLSSPVDHGKIILRTAAAVKRWGPRPVTNLLREASSWGLNREVGQDAPIWEAKRYVEKPILCDGDGKLGPLRKWYQQFYESKSAQAAE